MESAEILRAFLDENIECDLLADERLLVSFGDRYPWTTQLAVVGKCIRCASCLVETIPNRLEAVRKTCQYIEKATGLHCQIRDGAVFLWGEFQVSAEEDPGVYAVKSTKSFKASMDFAVQQLVFALESNADDHLCFALSKAYYHVDRISIRISNLEESRLFHDVNRRRFMERIGSLGVLTADGNPVSGSSREGNGGRNVASFMNARLKEAAQAKCDRESKKNKRLAIAALAAVTYLFLVLQLEWAFSSYGGEHQHFLGIRREFLVYGAIAAWFCLLIPPLMLHKGLSVKLGVAFGAGMLYTFMIVGLNNLWHFCDNWELFQSFRSGGYINSLFMAYWNYIKADLCFAAGWAEFRYPLVFVLITGLLSLMYYFRYASREKAASFLFGGKRDERKKDG